MTSERIKTARDALLHARMLLPRADPTTMRGEISRALVDALDALTDEVERLDTHCEDLRDAINVSTRTERSLMDTVLRLTSKISYLEAHERRVNEAFLALKDARPDEAPHE